MTALHLVAKYACGVLNVGMPAGKGVGMRGETSGSGEQRCCCLLNAASPLAMRSTNGHQSAVCLVL